MQSAQQFHAVKDFKHRPLDQSTNSIRLLRILPGRNKAPLQCKLTHATVQSDYACLSYMWGTDKPSHSILINGRHLRVRRNLFDFLTIARRLETEEWLWIDAICIDQANITERNHQVQQMADIYRRARHVLVYAGHISTSMRLRIRLNWSFLKRRPTPRDDETDDLESNDDGLKPLTALTGSFKVAVHVMLVRSFVKTLASLPYFERMWIIQELGLAQNRFLVTPRRLVHWWHIERFLSSSVTFDCHQPVLNTHSFFPERGGIVTWPVFKTILYLSKNCKCENIRDHIYGLLGLLDPPLRLSVDYSIEPENLLLEVISCAYEQNMFRNFGDFWTFTEIIRLALDVRLSLLCGQNCDPDLEDQSHDHQPASDALDVVTIRDSNGNLLSREPQLEAKFPSLILFASKVIRKDEHSQKHRRHPTTKRKPHEPSATANTFITEPPASSRLRCRVCDRTAAMICVGGSQITFTDSELEAEIMTDEQLEELVYEKVESRDFSFRNGLTINISDSQATGGNHVYESGKEEERFQDLPCLEVVLCYRFLGLKPDFLPVAAP